jgi:IclR family pca regulon transcriptional regulator
MCYYSNRLANMDEAVKRASAEGEPKARAPEGMAGLGKGLAIIEAFTHSRTQLMVADAARAAGTSRAAARRCLLTLTELGYLSHDGKHFRPTPRMLRLGGSYLEAASLPQLAQPLLEAARDALNESVSLAVLEQGQSVVVARAEADHIVSTGVRIGARLPGFCSATGRVLLSGLPEDVLDSYLAEIDIHPRTVRTLLDPAEIRRSIKAAAVNGYELSDEELELGMRAIAVPVHDTAGRVVGAISASAFTARISIDEMIRSFLPQLRMQAERLGRAL